MQEKNGYLPRDEMIKVCRTKAIPGTDVYGVATFYAQFKMVKRGRYMISVCRGTACHVRGSEKILDWIRGMLGIRPGQTTEDGKFSVQCVNCVGACAKAPNVMINDVVYGDLNEEKFRKIIGGLK